MRKIEKQMIQAIRDGRDWKSGNTEVVQIRYLNGINYANIYLHGNHIATVGDDYVEIFDGGYQSNTTKSRLNAIINEFCDALTDGVFQKDFAWYVRDNNVTKEFTNGYIFA